MSVCVQPVELADGDRTWTVLGADHRQVGPVEEFLEYHRVTGSSPHTVRAYAKALQLWWRYLELDGRDWAEADVPALAGFVTWLRQGTPPGVALLDPAAAAPPRLAESTLATRLAAVVSFYRYHHDAHGVAPALAAAWSDRKSTRLNSSHVESSYAVFCLKKKKQRTRPRAHTTQQSDRARSAPLVARGRVCLSCFWFSLFFFFNDTATTEIYTLSLHDALPIFLAAAWARTCRIRPGSHGPAARGWAAR